MTKLLRLKRKAPGLGVIAAIGFLQSLLPLYPLFNHPATFFDVLEDWEKAWAILRLPLLFSVLWVVCFSLVKVAQSKNLNSTFFESFNAWKGLAVLLLWPTLEFWRQLLTNYHQAFDFVHPLTSLVFMHSMALFLVALFVIPYLSYVVLRSKKQTKSDVRVLQDLKQNIGPNLLWGRFFFREVGSGQLGKLISYFAGVSYLIFFYMTILSLATPTALAVTTSGNTIAAHEENYIWATKYATHTGSYWVLDINSNDRVLQFTLNACSPCSRRPGTKVIVKHHPIDYRNRRISSVVCESDLP
jgi:hypothetical protein